MPAPPYESQPPPPAPYPDASLPSEPMPQAPSNKRTNSLIVAAGALVFIIVAGVVIGTHKSGRPRPEAKASAPVVSSATTQQSQGEVPAAAPPKMPAAQAATTPLAPASSAPWITPKAKIEDLRSTMASGRRPVSVTTQTASAAEPINACRALWTFDQVSGVTALDSSGNGFDATLAGDQATWTKDGRGGAGALKLAGNCYAETTGPVVDTSRSFTVAAWVNFDAFDKKCQTVVGIDGTMASAFYLQFRHAAAGDRFLFHRREKDDDNLQAKGISAKSNFSPELHTWYHLAGVYDADALTISLYVDGKLQESVPFTSAWQGLGKTSIGRGRFSGANVDFLKGSIADVRLYAAALTAGQIQTLAAPVQNLAAK